MEARRCWQSMIKYRKIPVVKTLFSLAIASCLMAGLNARYTTPAPTTTTTEAPGRYDLDDIIPDGYDARMRPGNPYHDNSTLNVSLSLYLRELMNVNSAEQTWQLDVFLIQEWYDLRLNLDNIPGHITIADPDLIERFWIPDLYIANGMSASIVNAFHPVEKLTVTEEGLMHFAIRVNTRMHCSLNLEEYPHDYQYCHIRFSSLTYNRTEVRYEWKRFDVYLHEYPQFRIRKWYTSVECEGWANPIWENHCVVATVKLVRHLSYYVIRYYLLTFLIVIITIVGFWVPINAWPARITVLIMPILSLITQDIAINNEIDVNYVTSFHWWMMWIHGFLWFEQAEYAVAVAWAHFITDKKNFRKMLEQMKDDPNAVMPDPPILVGYYFGNKNWYTTLGHWMDKFLYFFFGSVDYQLDPYTRNKVDYIARVTSVIFWCTFTWIYVLATAARWGANYE